MWLRHFHILWVLVALFAGCSLAAAVEFPGPKPGAAFARAESVTSGVATADRFVLENAVLSATWVIEGGRPLLRALEDRLAGRKLALDGGETFSLQFADGSGLRSSQMKVVQPAALAKLAGDEKALRADQRHRGWALDARFCSPDGKIVAQWSAQLRDGANYIVQELTLTSSGQPASVRSITLVDLQVPDAQVVGKVAGSPVTAGNWFFGCEHPMAANRVVEGRVQCLFPRFREITATDGCTATAAIGVAPGGQLRRAFLYYVERRRARPYRLFLNYNSWWDIANSDKQMTEAECLAVIECFGRELIENRRVALDSFVFDDGWDDPQTLWQFHKGFPQGFAPLQQAAARYRSAIGTWLSPWGGYKKFKAARIDYGKQQGFEINSRGFSLAGPKYYQRFSQVCLEMIRRYGVNYFKFDGIGSATGGDAWGVEDEAAPDVEALLRLSGQLRAARPDIYLSITTGTWPSPYWLWYGDSVWRNGDDCGVLGRGSKRRQWITYRDATVRRMIVDRAPLYPLNSLMTVTVAYGRLGLLVKLGVDAKSSPDVEELAEEIRMGFGSGTQLAELYLTPQLMSPAAWDVLAECVNWARQNADVLVDVHWVGGDPAQGAVYGYAAWAPRKGFLILRNPSDSAGKLQIDLASAFELPPGAARLYQIKPLWHKDPASAKLPERLAADTPHVFNLAPFQIVALEATPVQ